MRTTSTGELQPLLPLAWGSCHIGGGGAEHCLKLTITMDTVKRRGKLDGGVSVS